MPPTPSGHRLPSQKSSRRAPTTIQTIENDILCIIFSFLDPIDVVRCSTVCKSWYGIIEKSNLLQLLYLRQPQRRRDFTGAISAGGEKAVNVSSYLEALALEQHGLSLVEPASVHIDQWRAHSLGVDQCRMRMGMLLTGVGDKVVRLWSLESYKCLEEYPVPDASPLIDFDFDTSKIFCWVVGLVGTRICIWKQNGQRSIFPSRGGTFVRGTCMRYFDPEAIVGCEDGTTRVFDMYSRTCSRIIRMHPEPVSCLSLNNDQLIVCGSTLGRITVSPLLSEDPLVATLRPTDITGIKTLCFSPCSRLVFAGTTTGHTSCWDLRKMRRLWETQVSTNVIYTLQHMNNDASTLVAGGIDGILRVLNQNTGEVLSSYVMDNGTLCRSKQGGTIERKMGKLVLNDANIDKIPKSARPPITCLAVGMKKVVTTHNGKYVRLWRFNNRERL